jgi:hypothetical protein
MSARPPATRRGAHRSRRDVVGAFVPSLLAVLAVTALITAIYVWRGEAPDTATPASATTQRSSTAPAPSTPAPSKTASKAPVKPAPTTATSRPPSTKTKTTTTSADRIGDLEVVVLNATSRKGLAGTVAERLRDKGWTVALVGNFRGNVTATTVYYPPGAEADAQAAAAGLPTEPRVRPRFGNLSTTRLTVVVTDSYPS